MATGGWSVILAHERAYDEVLDCESGRWISLSEFLAGADYGDVVAARRLAGLLVSGRRQSAEGE